MVTGVALGGFVKRVEDKVFLNPDHLRSGAEPTAMHEADWTASA